jgi:hypothetical protein
LAGAVSDPGDSSTIRQYPFDATDLSRFAHLPAIAGIDRSFAKKGVRGCAVVDARGAERAKNCAGVPPNSEQNKKQVKMENNLSLVIICSLTMSTLFEHKLRKREKKS